MGKIKPSPEAIDMFMSLGERVAENVKRKLNEIATEDIYWGIITPSQAILMLYGLAPPTPKETIALMKEVFVEKEKILEQKYVDILEKVIGIYKKFEKEELKTISGKEIDILLEQSSDYMKRLKELMKQIEERMAEGEIEKVYSSVMDLVKKILGEVSEASILVKFEKELVEKAKVSSRNLDLLKEIMDVKKKHKKGNLSKERVASLNRAANELMSTLLEYSQRKELWGVERNKISIIYHEGKEKRRAELYVFKEAVFLVPDMTKDEIKKFSNNKLIDSDKQEMKKYSGSEAEARIISVDLMTLLKKQLGEFEIVF
jgi:uncharacterized protein (UPF0332 family)